MNTPGDDTEDEFELDSINDVERDPTPWWQTTTLAQATRNFRQALKNEPLGSSRQMDAWMRMGLIAHTTGDTSFAASATLALMRKLQQARRLLWDPDFVGGDCILHFKLTLALAENHRVSRGDAAEMAGLYADAVRTHHCDPQSAALARLGVHIRLGQNAQAEAMLPPLLDYWKASVGDDHGADRGEQPSALCLSGVAQILIEALLHLNRIPEAISIYESVAERDGCEGPCEAGPHGATGWLLQPLLRRGENVRADTLCKRNRMLAPATEPRHFGVAGDRVLHYAQTGQHSIALAELALAREALARCQPSLWQQLRFYQRSALAWPLLSNAGTKEVPAELIEFGDSTAQVAASLATQFDQRNGNTFVGRWWQSQSAATNSTGSLACRD